jgi:hypothetical protein
MDNIQLLKRNNVVLENAKLILATSLLLPFNLEKLVNGLPVPDAPIGVQLLIQLFKLTFNSLY